jgi:hypothetical protein
MYRQKTPPLILILDAVDTRKAASCIERRKAPFKLLRKPVSKPRQILKPAHIGTVLAGVGKKSKFKHT